MVKFHLQMKRTLFFTFIFCYALFINAQDVELVWQKSLGGSGVDFAEDLKITADGGFIIAGTSSADIQGYHGNDDLWIARLELESDTTPKTDRRKN